jgi:hypothetical protein
MLLRVGVLLAVAVFGCGPPARAATVLLNERSIPSVVPGTALAQHGLRLTGPLLPGDADQLRRTLDSLKAGGAITLELSSPGGDLLEGLQLGYLLRERGIAALVRRGDVCLSACALAFLGAAQATVEFGGRVAFHNFYINTANTGLRAADDASSGHIKGFDEARGGAALIVRYAADMNIDAGFIARLLGTPADQFDVLDTAGKFGVLHACVFNLKRPRQSVAAQATNLCNNASHAAAQDIAGRATPLQARQLSPRHARRYLLEHLRTTLAATSPRGSLATQLAAVLAAKDDDLIETFYAELRAAGVPLPDLIGQHFEVTGYRLGAEAVACFASLSLDDADRYDVSLMDRRGFSRLVPPAPPACPRLALYDPDEVINPGP